MSAPILVVARLLILAARVLNRVGLALGDQHLAAGRFAITGNDCTT